MVYCAYSYLHIHPSFFRTDNNELRLNATKQSVLCKVLFKVYAVYVEIQKREFAKYISGNATVGQTNINISRAKVHFIIVAINLSSFAKCDS